MKCEKCGMKLPNDSEFCQYCGKPIRADDNEAIIAEPKIEQFSIPNEPSKPPEESADIKPASNEAVAVAEESQKKLRHHKERKEKPKRYCKRCGGLVERKTKKCTSCGRQPFYKKICFYNKKLRIFTVSALIAVLLFTSIFFCVKYFVTLKNYENSSAEYNSLNKNYSERGRILNTVQRKLSFYESYAAIVPINSNYYHSDYNCSHCNLNNGFYIYSIEAAEYRDYKPCPYCH